MLPRKLHIESINKFHDRLDEVDKKIMTLREEHGDETSEYTPEVRDEMYKLTMEYFYLTSKVWPIIDDFCEFKIEHYLGILKNEDQKIWYDEFKDLKR